MAYIIAVCGAGGKTTLCYEIAKRYVKDNKKVCVSTTTHMWNNLIIDDLSNLSNVKAGRIYTFGVIEGEKLAPVPAKEFDEILKVFDYVILETDGSRMMPLKIPRQYIKGTQYEDKEPVVPKDVNEIIVVMGLQSIGREFNVVCQHGDRELKNISFKNLKRINDIVNEALIDELIEKCYLNPLREEFPEAQISIYKTDFTKSNNYKNIKKLALVLCASGFSRRFGDDNKLFAKVNFLAEDGRVYNLPLYRLMIEKLISSKKKLLCKLDSDLKYSDLQVDIVVVSQYEKILDDIDYQGKVTSIKNDSAELGLSSSIRISVSQYKDYDAIMFINSDLPKLPASEIALFLFNSICANSNLSSVYAGGPKNPAYFEKRYYDELLNLCGDVGAKNLLVKYMKESYKFYINEKYLYDIDTVDNLKSLNESYCMNEVHNESK